LLAFLTSYNAPARLTQIVSNLLTNALKYTPDQGHVWLSAEKQGREIIVRVQDDGIGIAPEMLPRLFDPFAQGSHIESRSEGGIGIGLALVRSLVQMHGGRVGVLSEGAGKGSEFIVYLPAAEHRMAVLHAVPVAGRHRSREDECS
jgi:signal transduction histidine kinase